VPPADEPLPPRCAADELLLDSTSLSANGVGAVAALMRPRSLLEELQLLSLGSVRIGEVGARSLAQAFVAGGGVSIAELYLGECDLGEGAAALADAMRTSGVPKLRLLELERNRMGPVAGRALARLLGSGQAAQLVQLKLNGNCLGDEAGAAFADALVVSASAGTPLQDLWLDRNELRDETCEAMAQALRQLDHRAPLARLHLDGNYFSEAACKVMAQALCDGAFPSGRYVGIPWPPGGESAEMVRQIREVRPNILSIYASLS
jgi:Ran GTPase-activating protein (RanGAP) involved in mRNA processing and transport